MSARPGQLVPRMHPAMLSHDVRQHGPSCYCDCASVHPHAPRRIDLGDVPTVRPRPVRSLIQTNAERFHTV